MLNSFRDSDAPLVLIKAGGIDNTNTQMMNVRWRFFHLWRQIPVEEQQELLPCGHCFAKSRALCYRLELKVHSTPEQLLTFLTFLSDISHQGKLIFQWYFIDSQHLIVTKALCVILCTL